MFSFFRKIRKSLINEGKTARYFKYAIGEILLVVIGILIALQLNNWNEQRKLATEETKMLTNLQLEIKDDIISLDNAIEVYQSTANSIDRIFEFFDQDLAYEESLKYDFHRPTRLWTPLINDSVYQALKSRGLDLISDNELSKSIITYYSYSSTNYDQTINDYRAIVLKGNREIMGGRFGTLWNGDYTTYRKTQLYEDLGGYMIPLDYEALKHDSAYRFYLSSLKNQLYWFLERPIGNASEMARQLDIDIEAELQRRTGSN